MAVIVLLLGVGIGATTLIFGFIDAAVLKPLPVRDPQSLFVIEKNTANQVRPDTKCFYAVYQEIQARKDLFSAAVASQIWTEHTFQPLDIGGLTELVSTQIVSPNYFTELGVYPILGRTLTPSDATLTSGIPIVLSYRFWRSQMNGTRQQFRRTLRIKGFPFRVVGVLPKDFHGLDVDRVPDVWLPISAASVFTGRSIFQSALSSDPLGMRFQVTVRLAPKISPAFAADAITRSMQEADARVIRTAVLKDSPPNKQGTNAHPNLNRIIRSWTDYHVQLRSVTTGLSEMRSQFSVALYVLMGAVALLLLAVCASVSGLLVANAERRKHEVAIRLAVGAGRVQVLRQMFVETLLWTLPSAGIALLFFSFVSPILVRLLPAVSGLSTRLLDASGT